MLSNVPFSILCSRAKTHGFKIHDVPGDGNCLFSSVAYQLPLLGLQHIDSKDLRTMVGDYLEENPIVDGSHYSNFLPSKFFITNDIEAQMLWNQYIEDLRNGGWGDNIAVRGISDMLNITINIISTQNPNIVQIAPSTETSVGCVYIGLLEQLHYV